MYIKKTLNPIENKSSATCTREIIQVDINPKNAVHLKLVILLLLKKVSSARLGESDKHSISPKKPAPQYQPIDRKKRKGKRVEDYSRDRAA